MTLFWRRFREEFRPMATWSLTVALVSVLVFSVTLLLGNLKETTELLNNAISQMPPVIRAMFGGGVSFLQPDLIAQTMLFGTIAPIMMMVFVSLTVLGVYTKDAGLGNLEFLFSLPVKRIHLVMSRVGVFLADLALLHIILFGAACVGAVLFDVVPNVSGFALASLNSLVLYSCLGGLTFLISMAITDYSRGILVALGIQFLLFLLNSGFESRSWALTFWNPFHYFSAEQLFRTTATPWTGGLVLTAAAVVFWLLGVRIYIRKQV